MSGTGEESTQLVRVLVFVLFVFLVFVFVIFFVFVTVFVFVVVLVFVHVLVRVVVRVLVVVMVLRVLVVPVELALRHGLLHLHGELVPLGPAANVFGFRQRTQ